MVRDQDVIIDGYATQRDESRQQLLLDGNKSAHRKRMRAILNAERNDPNLRTAVWTERDFMLLMRRQYGWRTGQFAIHPIIKSNANSVMHKMPDCWAIDPQGNVFLVEVKGLYIDRFSLRADAIQEYQRWNKMQTTCLFLFHRRRQRFSFIAVDELPTLVERCNQRPIKGEKHRDGSQKMVYEVPLSKISAWRYLDNPGNEVTLRP